MFSSLPAARMFVSFFSFAGLTAMSLSRLFSPTIMPFVDLVARRDEQFGPLLEGVQRIGHGPAGDHRDQHAVGPPGTSPSSGR